MPSPFIGGPYVLKISWNLHSVEASGSLVYKRQQDEDMGISSSKEAVAPVCCVERTAELKGRSLTGFVYAPTPTCSYELWIWSERIRSWIWAARRVAGRGRGVLTCCSFWIERRQLRRFISWWLLSSRVFLEEPPPGGDREHSRVEGGVPNPWGVLFWS